jgi:hypothetical protein
VLSFGTPNGQSRFKNNNKSFWPLSEATGSEADADVVESSKHLAGAADRQVARMTFPMPFSSPAGPNGRATATSFTNRILKDRSNNNGELPSTDHDAFNNHKDENDENPKRQEQITDTDHETSNIQGTIWTIFFISIS